ncbi:sodium-dependent phosphate pump NptA [Corynebacterium renale]|uniref:Na/Pi symporter n=1 Tax=Corynebacterium renale TaxID=1724 RepID=UPI000DA3698B|nr:Na/Pi symporter [Corynebacterium renale]SQG63314.1 sodium-dependent phosphate pump NptA [Corynebacterium renale]
MALVPTSPLGTQHSVNPKDIPASEDMVLLSTPGRAVRWVGVFASVCALFVGVYLIIDGVYGAGAGYINQAVSLAVHPILGLALGVVVTALVQSSTTTTALVIAAVGTGAMSVEVAIPVIMGANIGTTITPLMASLSFADKHEHLRRALSGSSMHLLFNLSLVVVLFPLELLFRPLERLSAAIAQGLEFMDAIEVPAFAMDRLLEPLIGAVGTDGLLGSLFDVRLAGLIAILLGTAMVWTALRVMSSLIQTLFAVTTKTVLESMFGASTASGFATGFLATVVVQASAVTISTTVPFAAAKTIRRRELFNIIVGANLGTTVGAFITAIAVPGALGTFAIQAALVHILFNLVGAIVFFSVPVLRTQIRRIARQFGRFAARNVPVTVALFAALYVAAPLAVLGIGAWNS